MGDVMAEGIGFGGGIRHRRIVVERRLAFRCASGSQWMISVSAGS